MMIDVQLDPFPDLADVRLPAGQKLTTARGPFVLSERTVATIEPRPKVNSWKWICENVHTKKGQPFNYIDFPWVEGICAAWDNPGVRRIFFQAGSRLGKTETFLALMLCAQHHDPDVGMIGGSTETLVVQTIRDRFYPMMEKTHATRPLLPPMHRRAAHKVRTSSFIIHGAWSGSPTTLGDLDPRYLQALELDKWTKNNSEEADPAELFFERGAEIPDRKLAAESTPTIKGMSRIDKYFSMGTARRYCVPCYKCGQYQALKRNNSGDPKDGGLWWDRDKDGKSTPSKAADTARYICKKCGNEWGEEHRKPAIRRGIWLAPGEAADKRGRVSGSPQNSGPDESFQLSRMYGPTFAFSDYARAFVRADGEPELERSFANNWDGEVWTPMQVEMTWQQLAEKLCIGDWLLGVAPRNVNFITTTVDVQVDHFVVTVWGWDHNQVGYLIALDTVPTWSQVKDYCSASYPHEDGGPRLPSFVNLIDSRDGNRKDEIVDFCKATNSATGPFVWPLMGARPGTMNLQMFKKLNIDADSNVGRKAKRNVIEGLFLVMINTTFTQEWLDNALGRRKPGEPMSLILPSVVASDQDFFEQLLNERFDAEKGTWVRIDETTVPVDFRDCVRYARAAAEVYCNGNWTRIPEVRAVTAQQAAPPKKKPDKQQRSVSAGRRSGFIRRPKNPFLTRGK